MSAIPFDSKVRMAGGAMLPAILSQPTLGTDASGNIIAGSAAATNILRATVDFGGTPETPEAVVTVPATWVTANTVLTAMPLGAGTINHDPDDPACEALQAFIENVVVGVSFDVRVVAPNETWGQYLINVIGIG